MLDKLQDKLLDLAALVDENVYLSSIRAAFTDFVPFIIVGSFSTLLSILVSGDNGLARWIPVLKELAPAFSMISFVTISTMTISIVFLIAMNIASYQEMPRFITGVAALATYLLVGPTSIRFEGADVSISGLGSSVLGAQGLFVGMIIAIVSTQVLRKLMSIEAIKIKLPSSVPHGIAVSFNTLIPIFILLVSFAIFGYVFYLATDSYLNTWIYNIVQVPLQIAFQSPIGVILMAIVNQVFWFLGVHGGMVIEPIRGPISAAAISENIALFNMNQAPINVLTRGFWTSFVVLGGGGITISLIFAILRFSKREDYRAISKLSLLPGISGINEPIIFGLPLVLNPIFAIPFIFNSSIAATIALIATKLNFISPGIFDVPPGIPMFINGFIGYGWQGVVVQIIIFVVTFFVWTPFVLLSNKNIEKEKDNSK
ncbi:MAG: PTS sugar transporter subunit IIC [Erysipelotrichaceae bacterium]|nr:PTS sugar transporter subunit IIC [Erysipelotrichaceae bacterium]